MRLELTTSAWKANMLPLHQWRIRRTEARLKEGGIYITFILYHIFFQLSKNFKKNARGLIPSVLTPQPGNMYCPLRLPHFFAVFLPPSVAVDTVSASQSPTTQVVIRFGQSDGFDITTEEGILLLRSKKQSYQYNLTSTHLREAPYSPTDSFGLKSVFFTPDDIRSFLYLTYILYHIFLRKSRKFLIFNPRGLLIQPQRISHLLVDLHNQTIHYRLVDLRLFPSRCFL